MSAEASAPGDAPVALVPSTKRPQDDVVDIDTSDSKRIKPSPSESHEQPTPIDDMNLLVADTLGSLGDLFTGPTLNIDSSASTPAAKRHHTPSFQSIRAVNLVTLGSAVSRMPRW